MLAALTAAAGAPIALRSICAALAASALTYEAPLAAMVRVNWSWKAAAFAASA